VFSVATLISENHTIICPQQKNMWAIPWHQTQSTHYSSL
jgi:hypothetical protein